MGLHPDVQKEKDAGFSWWRDSGSALKTQGSTVSKQRDTPDFNVALGTMQYSSGKHDIDFYVNRQSDGYVYVGVAVPDIALDQTFCRRDARDQVWYYFGCGYTNALRNGWDDIVSKEIGGSEMKIPKMNSADRIRASLDMDAGELKFSIFRLDEGGWKSMPGKITGIKGPVSPACCFQERASVSLSDSARVNLRPALTGLSTDSTEPFKRKNDKYAHIQSKLLADLRIPPCGMVMRANTDSDLLGERGERDPAEQSPPKTRFIRTKSERHVFSHPQSNGPWILHTTPSLDTSADNTASPPTVSPPTVVSSSPIARPVSERGHINHFQDFDLTVGRGFLSPRLSTTPRSLGRRAEQAEGEPMSPSRLRMAGTESWARSR
eukprot:CAMPEP_0181337238 /NCGR_PEP_ID=MMETSP1101-20121128/27898_1 /TAXON_ID=46948 /ORGANISM="Rhodomonas abbreviata, Strain Caron Lab Isolate" /LENGTH=377 /DNA_ID=CAMNT_0023447691 /DNA_START=138 /DNA_END=1268 /DNA_ORIENTATION=-